MSRIPQRNEFGTGFEKPWKPSVVPCDYSDEVTQEDIDALKRIVASEWREEDAIIVDGPAW